MAAATAAGVICGNDRIRYGTFICNGLDSRPDFGRGCCLCFVPCTGYGLVKRTEEEVVEGVSTNKLPGRVPNGSICVIIRLYILPYLVGQAASHDYR